MAAGMVTLKDPFGFGRKLVTAAAFLHATSRCSVIVRSFRFGASGGMTRPVIVTLPGVVFTRVTIMRLVSLRFSDDSLPIRARYLARFELRSLAPGRGAVAANPPSLSTTAVATT